MSNAEKMLYDCEQYEILIDGYLDGEIMPDEKIKLEGHLETCTSCRAYLNDTAKILEKTAFLPKAVELSTEQKNIFWKKIEQSAGPGAKIYAIDGTALAQADSIKRKQSMFAKYRYAFAAASAALILVIAIFTISRFNQIKELTNDNTTTNIQIASYWKVANVKGTPVVDDLLIKAMDSVGIGQWITTNDTSSAELFVSDIGKVTIEPGSKVKLVKSVNGEHRIQVQYGTIDAEIDANPRSFFVDMPSVTAVDLGCSYKLTVDSLGDGLVYVKQGKVSLEAAGRESLVPAGKFCLTKKDFGPGTPFQGDASAKFKKALMDFDFGNCAGTCVNVILKNAKRTDAVTLVSILPRVDANMKEMVYAKVAGFVAPPHAHSYDSIPQINPEELEKWIEKIQEEVQSKIEKNMEKMQADLENMGKDLELNGKEWEEWGKQWDRFGKELDFDKSYQYKFKHVPGYKDDEDNDSVGFDKEEFRKDMEEMKKNMDEMKNDFDKEQFKKEMQQSKEEMKRAKEEMKHANEEIKNAMKEMKTNMKFDFENSFDTTGHKMKIKIRHYDKDKGDQYEEIEIPDVNEVPDVPETPDVPEVPEKYDHKYDYRYEYKDGKQPQKQIEMENENRDSGKDENKGDNK